MTETKDLCINDKISFWLSNNVLDGIIINKELIDDSNISFTIELDNGKLIKVKNRNLDLCE